MIDVIQSGSAQHGQWGGYTIGGKTGTAELGDGTTNSLFIGFIGNPEPRYAIAVVLEGTLEPVAAAITKSLAVPTIGIGASPTCDGQVLVSEDVFGLFSDCTLCQTFKN